MSKEVKLNKITTAVIRDMKRKGEKISMLTGYDASMAAVLDEVGIDIILVGHSPAMTSSTSGIGWLARAGTALRPTRRRSPSTWSPVPSTCTRTPSAA